MSQGIQHAFQHKPRYITKKPPRIKGYTALGNETITQRLRKHTTAMGLLMHLKTMANLSPTEVRAFQDVMPLEVGGLVTGMDYLARYLGWSAPTVRKYLRFLADEGYIEIIHAPEGHVIYVVELRDAAIQSASKNNLDPRSLLDRSLDHNRSYNGNPARQSWFHLGKKERDRLQAQAQEVQRRILIHDVTQEPTKWNKAWLERFLGRRQ